MQKNTLRPRKLLKKKQDIYNIYESINISMNKSKNRHTIYYAEPKNKQDSHQIIKSINVNHKKSLEINNTQPVRPLNTTNNLSKPVYRRISYHQKNHSISKRYDEDQFNQSKHRATPYHKDNANNIGGRTSILNRSNAKINSGNLTKQLSPYQLYKQPRSSLSHNYDPTLETSLHKRRQSYVDEKNQILKVAKQYYKDNNFDKCCDFLHKYLKSNPIHNLLEVHYLLGMCLINKSQLDQGINSLLKELQIDPYYKKTLYLILALAYKRQQLYHESIKILGRGIELYPDYYDCMVYRGKMYLKQQKYEKARKDFETAIQLNKHKGFAYLGKGTCEIHLKMTDNAIKTFTLGLQTDLANVCYQKRGICYYQLNEFNKSLNDLEQASLYDNYFSSALHYYKGMIYYKKRNYTESLLSFQECLKHDNNTQLVTLGVEMMLKIKIQDKDFYQAYHIINRTQNVDIIKEVIQEWKLFLEGSLFLMKKKYKEGIELFDSLERKELYQRQYESITIDSQRQRFRFLRPLIHLYKAFGYLSENKPAQAQLEYQYHTQICESMNINGDNLSKKYNSLIVNATKQFPNNITNLLIQAKEIIPTKPQPYLFISFDILHKIQKDDGSEYEKEQGLDEIVENLTIGISHLPQLSNNHISSFYYFRSIILLYRQEFNKAVEDIDKAIEKSQDNIAKYFYVRGLIFACFGNFSQAVQDLTVAINLDQKYAKPFLQRAKCLQIQGNSNEAFVDLQKYITLAPQDQYIHKYAGFLLFQNCAYEDCLSAFSHGCDLPHDQQLILTKAKCNFLLGNYQVALENFKLYEKQTHFNIFGTDIEIIQICHEFNSQRFNQKKVREFLEKLDKIIQEKKADDEESRIFKMRDIHQLKGSILLVQAQYESALLQFNQTLNLFREQKQRQFQKNIVEDPIQFQQEWSEIEIKFNISLCHLCKKEYEVAYEMLSQFADSTEKGKNWESYIQLIEMLMEGGKVNGEKSVDTFEQNHRISKLWPKITLPGTKIRLSMAFSYPFVQPPEMMPEFDMDLFTEFDMKHVQPKPQAPWINRNQTGLVFTPNIQVYNNLQLSITTKKNEDEQQNKPSSQLDQSISMSNSQFQLQTEDLKKKFKLDSLVEMKLNRILKK